MAVCTYHRRDDSRVIPALAVQIQPAYRIHAKDVEVGLDRYVTKIMFFD